MRSVGIMARPDLGEAGATLPDLVAWLRGRGLAVCLEERTAELVPGLANGCRVASGRDVGSGLNVLVVLGGDGTLLAASHLIDDGVPILGVNFGSLGFLTEITMAELYPTLLSVLDGQYRHEERSMLRAVVHRAGQADVTGDVLNDVVVTKATSSRIIELDVTVDSTFVSAFRADGLILSSPTGSTAYNLAAGGPLLHPTLSAVVLTPICPHMLTNRPLVLSDSSSIDVRLSADRDVEVHVSLDGAPGLPLRNQDHVVVTRSPRSLRLVKAPGRDFFEVLRTKLKWGESTTRRV